MRLPRMTTRRWMVAVVVAGILCLLEHRRRSFSSLAVYHDSKTWHSMATFRGVANHVYLDANDREMTPDGVKRSAWHAALAEKYRQAALYPWLPVEPDPPEPE
jgi:hypothetical protein